MRSLRTGPTSQDQPDAPPVAGEALFALFNRLAILPPTAASGSGSLAVQVLGARAGVGASTIARALAQCAASQLEGGVLLIDADPRHPGQASALGCGSAISLQAARRRGIDLADAIGTTRITGLSVATLIGPDARHAPHEAGVIALPAIDDMMQQLRARFAWIVVDSATPQDSALGIMLARFMNGTVIVVEAEKTRTPVTLGLIRQLRANGGTPCGLVINKRRLLIPDIIYRFL